MSKQKNNIKIEYPKKLSAHWWHIYIFHIAIGGVKRSLWLQIQRLPLFLIKLWQMHELQPLLQQSYLSVPLYKKLLDNIKMKPADVRSYEDIQKLPITSKKLFRQYSPKEFVNSSFPEWSYRWTETSGSTGEPFKFPLNRNLYFFKKYFCGTITCIQYKNHKNPQKNPHADLYVDRFLLWRGFSFKSISNNFKFADIRVVNRPRGKYFLHIPVADIRENPFSVIAKLRKFKPDVLSGRATTLIEVGRIIKEIGKQNHFHVPFITSVGEMMTEPQRKYLKNFFDSEVYERYGLEELGDVAIECRLHQGMHINEESNIVEILDEQNRPLPPGSRGRIVVTNLCNYSVPFIRYDTGDEGEILPGKCSCGVTARRLKIHGRIGAYLEIGGKRYQFPEFALIVNDFNNFVLRSQVVKTEENKIEFRFIPVGPISGREISKIKNSFAARLGMSPVVKVVTQIPFNTSGKTQLLVDDTLHKAQTASISKVLA